MDSNLNETTENDFNSTLLDDGSLFSSHKVNTLSLKDLNNNINNQNIYFNSTNYANYKTSTYKNHRNQLPVISTELTQRSDPLNATLPFYLR